MSKQKKKVRYQRSYSLWSLLLWFLGGAAISALFFVAIYAGIFENVVEYGVKRLTTKDLTVIMNSEYDAMEQIGAFDSIFVTASSNVDTTKVGTYTTKYSVFLVKEFEQTVRVVDGEPPRLTLNGTKTMLIGNIENWVDPGATAYDAYEGDLTDQITTEVNEVDSETYKVIYTVEDSSGYKRTIERTLKKATGTEITHHSVAN